MASALAAISLLRDFSMVHPPWRCRLLRFPGDEFATGGMIAEIASPATGVRHRGFIRRVVMADAATHAGAAGKAEEE